MNDLISRLSEIRSNYNCFDENEEPYYRALSEAIQLASAQPERTRKRMEGRKIMDDLISREEILKLPQRKGYAINGYESYIRVSDIKHLPSAQPEQAVKDCRNCKHGKYNDYHDTYFCYNAEDCSNWDKWETSALHKYAQAEIQPEIIRCKDYKYYQFADNRAFGFPVIRCEFTGFEDVDDDDFCSRGERKNDRHN